MVYRTLLQILDTKHSQYPLQPPQFIINGDFQYNNQAFQENQMMPMMKHHLYTFLLFPHQKWMLQVCGRGWVLYYPSLLALVFLTCLARLCLSL